jgi:hypothetical protein
MMTTEADGIKPDMCLRCGMSGPHEKPAECIDSLRDTIATLQFRLVNASAIATRERAAVNGRTLGRHANLKPVAEIPPFVAG